MALDDVKLTIHTADRRESPPAPRRSPRRMRIRTRLSFRERLLRNSCLACAVLLGVLALGNLNQPWAKKAASGIQQALTMEVNLDESLGQLSFVRRLMPESALVFFNLSSGSAFARPVQGQLTHPYSAAQPWLMFGCERGEAVCAPADGTVAAVSALSDGSYGVLIDHGEGLESVLANLASVNLQGGEQVVRGATLGEGGESLYFELRQGGEAVDPTEKLGL